MRPLAPGSLRSIASRVAAAAAPGPRAQPSLCRRCLRPLSTTAAAPSGHNKWSKIRHKKGAADAQKNNMRSQHSKTIALYSRLYGTTDNPQLATAVANAKKDGVPKNVIESAIARGQGRTASGASLEPLTLEAILPPGVALIVEAETESKARSLQDLKVLVKKHKGAANAASFFFTRLGRVVFEAAGEGEGEGGGGVGQGIVDDVMDDAIEAGAEDLEVDDGGNLVVWTRPNATAAVAAALGPKFGLKLLGSDIVWSANDDTRVALDSGPEADALADLLAALRDLPEVQAVYGNPGRGVISEEAWARIEDNLDT
ncbi:YebC-like protein [Colletotrichum falcatum]|nr:YebC-like protein [Colletotrichum falcatum]